MGSPVRPTISIGCEAGGPEARLPCELKVALYQALAKHVISTHCASIDEYALVLRIDGSLAKYGQEGVHRVRLLKSRRYMSADIHVPELRWKQATHEHLKAYLCDQIRAALEACVQRLQKDRIAVAEIPFFSQVDAAMQEYTAQGSAPNNSFKPTPLRGVGKVP
ncbi:hypothetical protein MASR1M8_00290 [Thermomonas brevis]